MIDNFRIDQAKSILEDIVIDIKKLEDLEGEVYRIRDLVCKVEKMLSDIDAFKFDIGLLKDLLDGKK